MAIKQINLMGSDSTSDGYRLIGVASSAANYLLIDNRSAAVEGDTYYDTTLNQLRTYDGSSFSAAGQNGTSAGSLDDASQVGAKITNTDQIEIERSYASGAILVLDQNNAGVSARCLNLENASNDAASITADFASTNGFDIDGTSSTWSVDYQGDSIFNSVWLKDSKELQFGTATGGDVSFTWDQTNLLIEAETQNTGQIRIGSTNAIDLAIYDDSAANIFLFDISENVVEVNGWDINLQDDDQLFFGDSDDIIFDWDQTDFHMAAAAGGSDFNIGAAATNIDVFVFGDFALDGATAGRDVQWDRSENTLEVLDDAVVAIGTGDDVTLSWDQTKFNMTAAAADTRWLIGETAAGYDVELYFETSGTVKTDYDGHVAIFDGVDIRLNDNDYILFGDSAVGGSADGYIYWDQTNLKLDCATGRLQIDTDVQIGTTSTDEENLTVNGNLTVTGNLTHTGAYNPSSLALSDSEALNFGTGTDITMQFDGTDFLWDGAAADTKVLLGKTNNQDLVIYGGTTSNAVTYDTDDSALTCTFNGFDLLLQDDDELRFGDASGGDVSITWDQTNLIIDPAADDTGQIIIGSATKAMDLSILGTTATNIALFDVSTHVIELNGWDVNLQDDDILQFGDSADVYFQWDQTNFEMFAIAADTPWAIGDTSNGFDITYYFEGAGTIDIDFDGDNMTFSDDMALHFGDGDDITMTWDQTQLMVNGGAANNAVRFGDPTNVDIVICGGTTSNNITFDTDDSALICMFDGMDLQMKDDDIISFGDGKDVTMTWDQTQLMITGAAANNTLRIGDATNLDIIICGGTTSNQVVFDTDDSALICSFDGFDLRLEDDDVLDFGDGNDITMAWDQSKLMITGAAANSEIRIGDATNLDLRICGGTTSNSVLFDTDDSALLCTFDGMDLQINDDDIVQFGDAGTSDCYISWDQTQLQVVPSSNVFIGDKTNYINISSAGNLTATGTSVITCAVQSDLGGLTIPSGTTNPAAQNPADSSLYYETDTSKIWIHTTGGTWVSTAALT